MSQSQWPFEIIGEEPRHLIGMPCRAVLLQQFWFNGELAEPANIAYMLFGEEWVSLSIDAGVIFWRKPSEPPVEISKEQSAANCSYPLIDIGVSHGLVGLALTDISSKPIHAGSQVALHFQGGQKLILNNVEDCTSFEINGPQGNAP